MQDLNFTQGPDKRLAVNPFSRRQIMIYKDSPRTERIKIFLMAVDP